MGSLTAMMPGYTPEMAVQSAQIGNLSAMLLACALIVLVWCFRR